MIAGVTVGIMAVPEAISYANLAGLPSEMGMTATLVPCIFYALFGSSRQLVGCSDAPHSHQLLPGFHSPARSLRATCPPMAQSQVGQGPPWHIRGSSGTLMPSMASSGSRPYQCQSPSKGCPFISKGVAEPWLLSNCMSLQA